MAALESTREPLESCAWRLAKYTVSPDESSGVAVADSSLSGSRNANRLSTAMCSAGPPYALTHAGPRRFNEVKLQAAGVSQQMLTRTHELLERDGMPERTVRASTPPQVEYTLTELRRSPAEPVLLFHSRLPHALR
jgi:hypothetical protein